MAKARRSWLAGVAPLSPRRKWRAILLATLLLVPGYWAMLAGVVAVASDDGGGVSYPGAYIAFGLALIPFVFVVLAFVSEHPRAPSAVVKALVLAIIVGVPASAIAADAVTGLVAGLGAGGVAALRADVIHDWRPRVAAVVVVSLWVFLTLRTTPEVAILLAPVLPFTSIGVADHLWERRQERASRE
jgi:hypothetical protein